MPIYKYESNWHIIFYALLLLNKGNTINFTQTNFVYYDSPFI